ncbi:MAG TPA: helix-turn-helix domain-containing protein [Solirubrobacteraceae bacterium]|nr:helix-turn-helix domain-containing protein [Solirubrobacteraceae bacterium]
MNARGAVAGEAQELDRYSERILDAAREELVAYGLRRATLDDIAARARVGRATLYRRFANRDTLLAALVAREARRLIADVDAQMRAQDSPVDRLVAAFVAFISLLREHTLLRRLVVSDPEMILPILTSSATLALGRDYIAAQAAREQREGAVLTADPRVIGELLARFAHSLALTPDSVLPLDDEHALTALARATLVPLVFADVPE